MASTSSQYQQDEYPRLLHSGGFSLPPMVEDRLPIVTTSTSTSDRDSILQTNILLIKPPDMESLWEWLAYTKQQSDSDPSWGRVWPTALSLARLVLRSFNNDQQQQVRTTTTTTTINEEQELMEQAVDALRTASHVVEVGCGLGVAGLVYASSVMAATTNDDDKKMQRTITFLDREPYALHCVMASASTNGIVTGPIIQPADKSTGSNNDETNNGDDFPLVTARAAIDDWTLPTSNENNDGTDNNNSPIKNICYRDLHCDNQNTLLLASDILYEPSSMNSLATKLQSLLHPNNGGYALIADPLKERTIGCRDSFVKSVQDLGGEVAILDMPKLENTGVLESDMDIDGSLAETVLIVVHFKGTNSE